MLNVEFLSSEGEFLCLHCRDERQQAYIFVASGAQRSGALHSEPFNIYSCATIPTPFSIIPQYPSSQGPITAPTAVVSVGNPSHCSRDDEPRYLKNTFKVLELELVNVCLIQGLIMDSQT
jgi:hypothetical protein